MMQRLQRASIVVTMFIVYAASTGTISAESIFPDVTIDDALTIAASPAQPRPGESVTLTLSSATRDLESSTITWRTGSTVLDEGVGARSTRVTLGALGTSMTVRADLSDGSGTSITLTPASVDILWESDSYTPPLYAGKALPSAGSRVRLLAIPYLPRSGGGYYDAKDLVYTWRLDGGVLKNLSGRGKSSASVAAPSLFASFTISVDISTSDGRASGRGEVRLTSVEPQLRLYRAHPLLGVEYWSAASANTFVDESEATFAAVPFFAPVSTAQNLSYEWRVNGRALTSDSKSPYTVTLSSDTPGTRGLIDLTVTQPSNIFTSADGSWGITFMRAGDIPASLDPFRNTR